MPRTRPPWTRPPLPHQFDPQEPEHIYWWNRLGPGDRIIIRNWIRRNHSGRLTTLPNSMKIKLAYRECPKGVYTGKYGEDF